MGKVISIYETSGCPGRNILGLNLALALSSQQKDKTAFIDLSFSGTCTVETILSFKPGKTAESLVSMLPNIDSALLKGFLPEYKTSVAVLEGISSESKTRVAPDSLGEAIKIVSSNYPYTIISLPEDRDEYLTTLINVSDLVILSVMPHVISLKEAAEFIDNVKSLHFPLSIIKVLVNSIDSKYSLDNKKIESYLSIGAFAEIPFDPDSNVTYINGGTPAVLSDPTGIFSNKVKSLAKQLVDPILYETTKSSASAPASSTTELSVDPQAKAIEDKKKRTDLKKKLHKQLIAELNAKRINLKDFSESAEKTQEIRELSRKIIQGQIASEETEFTREERAAIVDEMLDEVLGLGCIEVLLKDPDITEIMVNGPYDIYIEKKGRLTLSDLSFTSTEQLMNVIDRIVSPLGRRIDESSPLVDARLADGSRVNAIIPPLSLVGPSITIRKFSKKKLDAEDLIKFGAMTKQMAEFLRVCVQLRKNIVVSGGTGSGKTTLLNVVSSFIPEDERILTIEDSAELKLPQKHVVRLESRPSSIEGTGEISIRRLVINALRMRPDRIVVGECRGGETLDMLQAMNTGHDGSLTTIHSNSPKDGISRIATMVMMAGMDLPEKAIREQIASAVHIIVQLSRISDGSRKVVEITEITGIKEDVVGLVPIFKYEQTGTEDGKVIGRYISTGNKPSFINEIDTHGLVIDKNIFNNGELL